MKRTFAVLFLLVAGSSAFANNEPALYTAPCQQAVSGLESDATSNVSAAAITDLRSAFQDYEKMNTAIDPTTDESYERTAIQSESLYGAIRLRLKEAKKALPSAAGVKVSAVAKACSL